MKKVHGVDVSFLFQTLVNVFLFGCDRWSKIITSFFVIETLHSTKLSFLKTNKNLRFVLH